MIAAIVSRVAGLCHRKAARHAAFEGLEGRTLLSAAPTVTGVSADNRGEVTIQLSAAVTGVSKSSVKLFTPGANGAIGDADDLRQPSQVVYTAANHRITIKGKLAAGTGYRIRVQAAFVKGIDGQTLDGEFTGSFHTGDGHAGGNFAFIAKNDKSLQPTARFSTSDGNINVVLLKDHAPLAVANFLSYANNGLWDGMFWSNAAKGVLLQGGELHLIGDDDIERVTPGSDVALEKSISNTRGTLSFGHTPTNTETDGFFFNVSNNDGSGKTPNLDKPAKEPAFTVFAKVKSAADQAVVDASAARGTISFNNQSLSGVSTTAVPVNSVKTALKSFLPSRDLIVVRRVALMDKISALA